MKRLRGKVLNQLSLLVVVAMSLSASLYCGARLGLHFGLIKLHPQVVTFRAADAPAADEGDSLSAPPGTSTGAPVPSGIGGEGNGLATPQATEDQVYQATTSGQVNAAVADIPERVYVPNSTSASVDVIDPATFQVVAHLAVGQIPYHITPAWDMSRLYVDNEKSNSLTVIDPRTTALAGTIPMSHPYNLYFTLDGSKAIVVTERFSRLEFRDPHSWALIKAVAIPFAGVDHLDFSADGSYFLASCEFTGAVVKVDAVKMELAGMVNVGGLPIDVRLSPDGTVFYVANQGRGGVSVVDPVAMREVGFIATGRGAHGFQVSRDARSLYVSNRLAGTISVIDFASRKVTATWTTGGSPDMLQISPDGKQLWASGRYNSVVYVVDTGSGALIKTIKVGNQPHGLAYFPNVGRFSLGHNGVYR